MELYDIEVKFTPHSPDKWLFECMLDYLQQNFPRHCQVYGNFKGAFFEVWGMREAEMFRDRFHHQPGVESVVVKESSYRLVRRPPTE